MNQHVDLIGVEARGERAHVGELGDVDDRQLHVSVPARALDRHARRLAALRVPAQHRDARAAVGEGERGLVADARVGARDQAHPSGESDVEIAGLEPEGMPLEAGAIERQQDGGIEHRARGATPQAGQRARAFPRSGHGREE
ncbi:MAG: hypothetical protein IPK07_14630 [Deltaproteobacteria bacterium]|nr:hypothetical protein [Deltaproteobacteria bacterium]